MSDSKPQTAEDKIIAVLFEGKQEKAREVEFDTEKENWSSYRLQDGTIIKLKNVVSRILQLVDRRKNDGSPMYIVEGAGVVTTIPPSTDPGASGA